MKEKQEALTRQRKSRIPAEIITEEVSRSLVSAYIIGRIVIVPPDDIQQLPFDSLIYKLSSNGNNQHIESNEADNVEGAGDFALLDDLGKDSSTKSLNFFCESRKTAFEKDAKVGFEVKIQAITGDENVATAGDNLDYVMSSPPDGLEPVFIPRRKKTTHEDFKESLRSFKTDTLSLSTANARAGKLAGLAKTAVDGFRTSGR